MQAIDIDGAQIPRAVYSTLDAAKAHVPLTAWADEEGGADGRSPDGREWIIGRFTVDAPNA